MQTLTRTGLEQYRKRQQSEREFVEHSHRVRELLDLSAARADVALLCLTPLVSIAWTDGKVGQQEQDAVLKAAEEYGILDSEPHYSELMERLTTRPVRAALDKWWEQLAAECTGLKRSECAAIASHLYQQTKYIGELSEEYVFGRWRSFRMGKDEQQHLEMTVQHITEAIGPAEKPGDLKMLVPLVQVAWADGRVTRQERQMILDSMVEMDIPSSEGNLRQLADWLELRPDDDFFIDSLRKLRNEIATAGDEHGPRQKYDIISRCTLVAEASGGIPGFVGGGSRISPEEAHTVKNIARILNGAMIGS